MTLDVNGPPAGGIRACIWPVFTSLNRAEDFVLLRREVCQCQVFSVGDARQSPVGFAVFDADARGFDLFV